MKCKMCKKETKGKNVFCDECKKKLEAQAPSEDIEELEDLIEKNEKLEVTKDLSNLKDLINNNIDDDFKDIKDSKLVVAFSILFGFIIVGIITFLVIWFINRPKKVEEEVKPTTNYEEILKEYGEVVSSQAKEYILKNEEVPTWQALSETIDYDKHEISCQTHTIYSDGSIYLNHCKVDNKTIKYTYGEEKTDDKTGKELSIYKVDNVYSLEGTEENLVGKLVCSTLNCEFEKAFDKYVIVKEKDAEYLYNYENNTVEFGPYNDGILLNYNNALYGIYYKTDGVGYIYNVNLGKTIKNIPGKVDFDKDYIDTGIQYKYGYLITYNNGFSFVNLKTGNSSFTIKENIKSFMEDIKSGILYIIIGDKTSTKFKIYNNNGKLMFNGDEFIDFKINNNSLVTITENVFKVYDTKLNLKTTSKTYNSILKSYEDFIVVIDKKIIKIVDYNDKEIASFETEWNSDYRIFDTSFRYNVQDKVLSMIFENISNEEEKYAHYTYEFNTKVLTEEFNDTME